MSESKPVRPPQVAVAGWLVVAGSVVVVLMAFSRVAELRSLETQEAIEAYLSSPPGDSLGLSVSGAQTLLRIASMVAAACAAASAVLGWQVLQRSRGARLALSLLAAPLFVTGLLSGGVPAAVVTAAIVMLWFQPARDWFDGISRPEPAPRVAAPPPVAGDREALRDLPPPTQPPLYPTAYAATPGRAPDVSAERPQALTWACVLTWVGSAAAFVLMAALIVSLLGDSSIVADARSQNPDLADAGLTDTFLRNAFYATAGVAMAWSAAAAALAVLVWRGVRWAATGLAISAGAAGLMCLLTVIGSLTFIAPLAVCAAALALLLRPESRAWLRSDRSGSAQT
jgi:hypothetical protein